MQSLIGVAQSPYFLHEPLTMEENRLRVIGLVANLISQETPSIQSDGILIFGVFVRNEFVGPAALSGITPYRHPQRSLLS